MSMTFDLGGVGMWDEEGRRFYVGNQVIFQDVDDYDHQVDGDIGVIVSIANEPDERDHQDYMAVWLYRSYKVVRAFEGDVLHHKGPDVSFHDDAHQNLYDIDWWVRLVCYTKPPTDIKWSSFVDPHTGNTFARGDCVVSEENYASSQFDRHNVDVNVGDKCVLLFSL